MNKPLGGHTPSGRRASIASNRWGTEMRCGSLLLLTSLILLSTSASGQGDEKREKPEKVTSAMMQKQTADSAHHDAGQTGESRAAPDTAAERDFNTIRAQVASSTTFVVIKALALAVAIVGLGVVYIPRRTGGSS